MPLYVYECVECGFLNEFMTEVEDYENCPTCGIPMKRVLQPFNINMGPAGASGYYDDNLGKYINTNYERREEMKKQGVTEKYGKGWY